MLCRLTAMGVETPEISRRDIFTLFVLCRLLNFLKELPAGEGEKQLHAGESSEISLDRWVVQLRSGVPDRHILDGLGVAERLIETGRFYALTAQGEQENTFFNPVLFRRAWNRIEQITALDGAKIRTSN
ncbi:MAG: hypothetical protein P8Y94_03205 [Acidobacteriota bacterium]